MARIGFIGLGNMGGPMARNLLKAGHEVHGFDLVPAAMEAFIAAGGKGAADAVAVSREADFIVTMLTAGKHVRDLYLAQSGLASGAKSDAILIDCSTIDVGTSREVAAAMPRPMLDAPVSGGTMGAESATLTFMVGGPEDAFARARPILEGMGKTIVHCGAAGAGQAAKACNNMMLAINMVSTCEGLLLAEKLGLSHQVLFDIVSRSSGQSWALNTYCPVPGPVPASPANRDYKPGFAAALMHKDLSLAQQAAKESGAATPFGAAALALYDRYMAEGNGHLDFSGIMEMIRRG